MKTFTFLEPGPMVDKDLQLVLVKTCPADPEKERVPAYEFEMRHSRTGETLGHVNLRIGNTDKIVKYGGHIGYGVVAAHRGHHYAARSCQLLFPFARSHGLTTLWVTCNPDNLASRRTCEIAGGTLVEVIDLPEDNDQYQRGDRQKCRYRFDP